MYPLMKVDNIQSEGLVLYNFMLRPRPTCVSCLKKEIMYYYNLQTEIFEKYNIDFDYLVSTINSSEEIPDKFKLKVVNVSLRNIMERRYYYSHITHFRPTMYNSIKVNRMHIIKRELKEINPKKVVIDNALISLIEQKGLFPNILSAFKELNINNGISFKEYIDNWCQRLMKH